MHEMHEPKLYQLNHHSHAQSGAEHGLVIAFVLSCFVGHPLWNFEI